MNNQKINQETIDANKYIHAFLAKTGEYNKSPHFKQENQIKVKNILLEIVEEIQNKSNLKLIDFGCGTGFIINIAKDMFSEIHGIDITQEMLDQVDLSSGNIFLYKQLAENTTFEKETFDLATAYSFMDHLTNYRAFLEEVYRVLKVGGVFYSDLNPNKKFIKSLYNFSLEAKDYNQSSSRINREIISTLDNGKYYYETYGINPELLTKAEPIKSFDCGFDENEVLKVAYEIGFKNCVIEYEWFLDEGAIIHSSNPTNALIINEYLLSLKPYSSIFYKYLRFKFFK